MREDEEMEEVDGQEEMDKNDGWNNLLITFFNKHYCTVQSLLHSTILFYSTLLVFTGIYSHW